MRGLVFEGGGAKGSYQIGVYQALMELNMDFDYIVGTSIGAINAAMICQGDFELAKKLWLSLSYSDILETDDKIMHSFLFDKVNFENIKGKIEFLKQIIENKGIGIEPLKNLLDQYIDEDKIRKSKIKFGLNTVDVKNMRLLELFIDDIQYGHLIDYIRASSNLLLFKQEYINGKKLIDGGYLQNNPYKMIDNLCDEIVIVSLKPYMLSSELKNNKKYTIIKSYDENFPKTLEFNNNKAKYGIKLGYYDTLKIYKNLWGSKYYFSRIEKTKCLDILLDAFYDGDNLKEFIVKKLYSYIEKIGGNINMDYDEIIEKFLEKKARESGIERFKIYKIEELVNEILKNGRKFNKIERRILNSIKNLKKL